MSERPARAASQDGIRAGRNRGILKKHKRQSAPGITLAGALFIIGGLVFGAMAVADGLAQTGALGGYELTANGSITKIDHTGNMFVSFDAGTGEKITFETASLNDPPGYDPPYIKGETVGISYSLANNVEARIDDPREWIRIAALGLFGAIMALWGWLAIRFGVVGVAGGLVIWLGSSEYGPVTFAALLGI